MHDRIESRLFDAVLLVLASAGCAPAPTPAKTTTVTHSDGGQEVRLTNPADVETICKNFKERTRVDPSEATDEAMGQWERAVWNPHLGVAQCSIVRDTISGNVEVMHTPTCCPQGMPPGHQCPGPTKVTVPGTAYLMQQVDVRPDGSVVKSVVGWAKVPTHSEPRHNCGRRPAGVFAGACSEPGDLGAELAAMAELEAVSVPAFDRLARELAAHGAPADLVRRARIAMGDEVRHARMMTELAAQFGGTPRAIEVPALPIRALDEIGRENAAEGCVREAYGALVATYQGETAAPALREVFRAIARDEREHAALAEDVDRWIGERLDATAREDLMNARASARIDVRASLESTAACETLGIPGGARAVALFDAYFA
jgi:bacterioferritin (cytochrome b1)